MVAGFEKTFEIGRQFRNEGMDAEHLQDYTQMEFYWAYADYEKGMALGRRTVKIRRSKNFRHKLQIRDSNGFSIDLGKKWESMITAILSKNIPESISSILILKRSKPN